MNYTKADCLKDTKQHISEVQNHLEIFIHDLQERGRVHDLSKLESPELEIFTEYTPKLKTSTYGSDEYKENLKGMHVALEHHYENNSHHPEHYKKYVCDFCYEEYRTEPTQCKNCTFNKFQVEADVSQMDLLDIVEMFCDWKAATMRHADGDLNKSIEINKKRFGYSDELEQIFKNSVKIFG